MGTNWYRKAAKSRRIKGNQIVLTSTLQYPFWGDVSLLADAKRRTGRADLLKPAVRRLAVTLGTKVQGMSGEVGMISRSHPSARTLRSSSSGPASVSITQWLKSRANLAAWRLSTTLKSSSTTRPSGGTSVRITVNQQGWRLLLEVSCEVHSRCGFAHSSFEASPLRRSYFGRPPLLPGLQKCVSGMRMCTRRRNQIL